MSHILSIDLGSGFTKAIVFDGSEVLVSAIMPSGSSYRETAQEITRQVLAKAGLSFSDISRSVATGYGAGMVDFCDQSVTDISCHAAGVYRQFSSVRTIIDVGAQFTKVIRLDETGRVSNFVLNEKCAGGSGRFLQVIARILRMSVEEIGKCSLKSLHPVEFTTGCAVFAESEAVSRIAEGASAEDILAGIHKAMASKIGNLVVRLGISGDCSVTGGGAKDTGLVRAIEDELRTHILVPREPQITAAFGAALLAEKEPH